MKLIDKLKNMTQANGCTLAEEQNAKAKISAIEKKEHSPDYMDGVGLPYNAFTQIYYAGENINRLSGSGFVSNQWATYKQWANAGKQVKKGQKSTKCQKFGKKKNGDKFFCKFSVFNVEQTERFEGDFTPELPHNPTHRIL